MVICIQILIAMTNLDWLAKWFINECNGDWEHSFQIKIQTLSNPGWMLTIDLCETELEGIIMSYQEEIISDHIWFGFKIVDNVFVAFGHSSRLDFLIRIFVLLTEMKGDLNLSMVKSEYFQYQSNK